MSVPSPCTEVCTIDATTGWCTGCKRTIEEIGAWGTLDDAAKLAVWARLPARGFVAGPDAAGPAEEAP